MRRLSLNLCHRLRARGLWLALCVAGVVALGVCVVTPVFAQAPPPPPPPPPPPGGSAPIGGEFLIAPAALVYALFRLGVWKASRR